MRFSGLALLASALVIGACAAGGEDQGTDTAAAGGAAGTQTPVTGGSGQMAPVTGTTHEVRMMFDGQKYFFEPATLTIKQGDGVKWIMVSGAPHNVQFRPADIPAGAEAQLQANMPNAPSMMGPMMLQPNEEYTVSFAGVPAGAYNYVCTPHEMMNMKGTITVQ